MYKAKNGETIIINENLKSIMQREGFELVGEVDQKGKLIKQETKEKENEKE